MKLQRLREEIYHEIVNTTSWLKKWLNDDEVDPYHWSWLIPTWASEMDIDVDEDQDYDSLAKSHQRDFKMWLRVQYETNRLFQYPPETHQANHYYTGGRVVKADEWLIHFTPNAEDALDIAKGGFKKGVPSHNLHISATADKFDKDNGEFAFAFKTVGGDYAYAGYRGKYGMNAVLFQTESGIESYHVTDNESQVIFDKTKTRNRIPIYFSQSDKEWFLEDKRSDRELIQGKLEDIVAWVKKNFDQYRKSIVIGSK